MMSSYDSSSSVDSCDTNSDMDDLIEVVVAELSKNIKDGGGDVLLGEEIGDEDEDEMEVEAGVEVEGGVEVEPEVGNVVQQSGYEADMEDD